MKTPIYTEAGAKRHAEACRLWRKKNPHYEHTEERRKYKRDWKRARRKMDKEKKNQNSA